MIPSRTAGGLLPELMVAVSVLTVGVLSFLATFQANANAFNTVNELDESQLVLENACELLRGADLSSIYTDYDGATLLADKLRDLSDGTKASVTVNCFVNENALPP
ncbi:MAG: hypothetical protein AAF517_26825, partial [Planctomycetota bacterium]